MLSTGVINGGFSVPIMPNKRALKMGDGPRRSMFLPRITKDSVVVNINGPDSNKQTKFEQRNSGRRTAGANISFMKNQKVGKIVPMTPINMNAKRKVVRGRINELDPRSFANRPEDTPLTRFVVDVSSKIPQSRVVRPRHDAVLENAPSRSLPTFSQGKHVTFGHEVGILNPETQRTDVRDVVAKNTGITATLKGVGSTNEKLFDSVRSNPDGPTNNVMIRNLQSQINPLVKGLGKIVQEDSAEIRGHRSLVVKDASSSSSVPRGAFQGSLFVPNSQNPFANSHVDGRLISKSTIPFSSKHREPQEEIRQGVAFVDGRSASISKNLQRSLRADEDGTVQRANTVDEKGNISIDGHFDRKSLNPLRVRPAPGDETRDLSRTIVGQRTANVTISNKLPGSVEFEEMRNLSKSNVAGRAVGVNSLNKLPGSVDFENVRPATIRGLFQDHVFVKMPTTAKGAPPSLLSHDRGEDGVSRLKNTTNLIVPAPKIPLRFASNTTVIETRGTERNTNGNSFQPFSSAKTNIRPGQMSFASNNSLDNINNVRSGRNSTVLTRV